MGWTYIESAGSGYTVDDVATLAAGSQAQRKANASVALCGINDILAGSSAASIIADLQALVAILPNPRLVCIPPFGNNAGWTSGKEAVRVAVNNWIRTTANHTDAELILGDGDPTQPALLAEVDGGDGLHINHSVGDVLLAAAMKAQSFA